MNKSRPYHIALRATADEKFKIKEAAVSRNCSVQKYLIDAAIGCPPIMSAKDSKKVVANLRSIGNNLNQIAHKSNMGHQIDKYDLLSNVEAIEALCQSLKRSTAEPH